ncbi:uncharacterized protein LOC132611904 [Lycium barbarum]|uniref:uncharacterized protein LOC132611904 n=1 Tax=Lycium barbarum TaxID=112863 RepID=UPI00293F5A12|nr:uncharacterized protein LOC132611904 [Lycium barbarum]
MKDDLVECGAIPTYETWFVRKILEARKFIIQATSLQGDLQSKLQSMVSQSKFSIKKIHISLMPPLPKTPWKSLILKTRIHPRYNFTLWLALMRRLAIVVRLLKFGTTVPPTCVFYGLTDEILAHIFFECNTTETICARLLLWIGLPRTVGTWEEELRWTLIWAKRKSGKGEMVCTLFALVIALLWRERNRIRFQNGNFRADMLCREMAIHIHTRGPAKSTCGVELSKLQGYP